MSRPNRHVPTQEGCVVRMVGLVVLGLVCGYGFALLVMGMGL